MICHGETKLKVSDALLDSANARSTKEGIYHTRNEQGQLVAWYTLPKQRGPQSKHKLVKTTAVSEPVSEDQAHAAASDAAPLQLLGARGRPAREPAKTRGTSQHQRRGAGKQKQLH